jgi:hypothetical protein
LELNQLRCAQRIQRAGCAASGNFQHMGVNHGGAHIAVAQQLLHGANIGACLQQVRGKAVAQSVHRGVFGNARLHQRSFESATHSLIKQVVAPLHASAWVDRQFV